MMDAQTLEIAIRSARAVAAFTVAGDLIAQSDPHVEAAIRASHAGDRDATIAHLHDAAAFLGQPVQLVIAALAVGKRLQGGA